MCVEQPLHFIDLILNVGIPGQNHGLPSEEKSVQKGINHQLLVCSEVRTTFCIPAFFSPLVSTFPEMLLDKAFNIFFGWRGRARPGELGFNDTPELLAGE